MFRILLYMGGVMGKVNKTLRFMRSLLSSFSLMLAAVLMVGCAGPERKLGRGFRNVTEFARMGEIRRSYEQTALWDGPAHAGTTGLIRGVNRSIARTALGAYEIVTFPFPSYDPLFTGDKDQAIYPDRSIRNLKENWGGMTLAADPVYPASYAPGYTSGSVLATDTSLGFSGGEIAPMVPGSRFRIFDN